MPVHLVHGIREFKGGAHMEPLRLTLEALGVPALHVGYGPVWIPITNQRATNAVLEAVEPGDDVVAFSNGCWAAHQAIELGCPIRHLYLISPALNVRAAFPGVEGVTVYASRGDAAVLAGKWWRRVTRVLPWRWRNPHGWGAMGRYGYQGDDPRVTTVFMGPHVGHGWARHPGVVRDIAEDVARRFRGRESCSST